MAKARSMHSLSVKETQGSTAKKLSEFAYGDLFVREGTPCMRLAPPDVLPSEAERMVAICNLTNGAMWFEHAGLLVWPVCDATLTFASNRI